MRPSDQGAHVEGTGEWQLVVTRPDRPCFAGYTGADPSESWRRERAQTFKASSRASLAAEHSARAGRNAAIRRRQDTQVGICLAWPFPRHGPLLLRDASRCCSSRYRRCGGAWRQAAGLSDGSSYTHGMIYRGTLIGLAAVAAIVLPATAAGATVSPTPAQKAAIIKAFGDPKSASSCLTVRLAASKHNYATVRFRMVKRCRKWAFNGVNVLKRVRDRHWKVVFEASAYRCPVAHIPRQVQRDLGICR